MAPELVTKQLEILKEVVPTVSRMAPLGNPVNAGNAPQLRYAQDTARTLGVRLQPLEVRGPHDLDRAFAAMTTERAEAFIVLVDAMLLDYRTRIADLAATYRLPAVYGLSDHAAVGGLVACGASVLDRYRRASTFVDKILRGAKLGDLPVEQPTKFELVINLKTAKDLGLTIPPTLLFQAYGRSAEPQRLMPSAARCVLRVQPFKSVEMICGYTRMWPVNRTVRPLVGVEMTKVVQGRTAWNEARCGQGLSAAPRPRGVRGVVSRCVDEVRLCRL
jgi:hypothetical protein